MTTTNGAHARPHINGADRSSEELFVAIRDDLVALAEATARSIVSRIDAAKASTRLPVEPVASLPTVELTVVAPVPAPNPPSQPAPVPAPSVPARAFWPLPVEALLPMIALVILLVVVLAWVG